jgi:hypothetical protein
MTIDIQEKIAKLDPPQRRKVEERAAKLIAEEMTERELRKARQRDRGVTGGEARGSSRSPRDPAP